MDNQMQQMMTLFTLRAEPEAMARQIQTLRTMLLAVTQEVVTLRALLLRSGTIDSDDLREALTQTLSGDHNGAGAFPWQAHSWYPFLSEESERLRALGATDEDIAAFKARCEFLSKLS